MDWCFFLYRWPFGGFECRQKTSFLACEKRTAFIFTTQSFFQLASPKSSAEFQENFSLFRNHLRAVWTKNCSSVVGLFGLYYMALYQPVLELLYCCYSPNNSGIQLCHIIICRQYFKQFLWQNQLFSYRQILINATDKIPT